jgi:cell division protein ZapA
VKQMEVTIMGQSYILGCPEGGETSLLEAVSQVDREMGAIRDAGKVKARERIAVLAALNLAYARSAHLSPAKSTSTDSSKGSICCSVPMVNCCDTAARLGVRSSRPLRSRESYISLNLCSYEQGLGTSPRRRDRLASDEPKAWLTSPT